MKFTNDTNIPIGLAVWLAHDDYDYVNIDNYISVTKLMKPVRELLLSSRVESGSTVSDISTRIASASGSSLHAGVEKSWESYAINLRKLGYPDSLISKIKINPSKEDLELDPSIVPIYVEKRSMRKYGKWTIGGKFDLVIESRVEDIKSTSTYTWTMGNNDNAYSLQGSLYRWLNQDIIIDDHIRINFIFTDWSKLSAKTDKNYPQARVAYKDIPLMSIQSTDSYIKNKLAMLEKYQNSPQSEMPLCTSEELWETPTVYKYYKDPKKTDGRSSKNFSSLSEANKHRASLGEGVVKTVLGTAKKCDYCSANSICEQRKSMNI